MTHSSETSMQLLDVDMSCDALHDAALRQVPSALFITVSGAHLYGFPSPDSDFDLRGCHLGALEQVLGLGKSKETLEQKVTVDGREVEIVSHEVGKYLRLLMKPNGYVIEQIYSPLMVITTPEHEELKTLAKGCICRELYFHYRGFAQSEIKQFVSAERKTAKRILYIYRVLMSGVHVLRTGEVNANIVELNETFGFGMIAELIQMKQTEQAVIPDESLCWSDVEFLRSELDRAFEESPLPPKPTGTEALSRFLVGLRKKQLREGS